MDDKLYALYRLLQMVARGGTLGPQATYSLMKAGFLEDDNGNSKPKLTAAGLAMVGMLHAAIKAIESNHLLRDLDFKIALEEMEWRESEKTVPPSKSPAPGR